MTRTVVVIGSSVAGVSSAQALRSEGFGGRIVLVGEEEVLPYDKPPLSKEFLAGKWDADRVNLLSREDAERGGIELRLGAVATRLDVAGRQVLLSDGSRLGYDKLVVATGAAARPSPWNAASGVHVLRTLRDSRALRERLERFGGPVVVVGGGFIGGEVAATVRALGHEVTVVDPLPIPSARAVGEDVGRHLTELHRRHGVETRFGLGVEEIREAAGWPLVRLTDGTELPAATVIVGIGAVPNDRWLADSGIRVDNGVLCDSFSRAVGAPDVYVAGDVARWFHRGHREHVRVEHWTNAVEQAACVAHNIVHPDDPRPYQPVEYVWSDQYDWKIQLVGRPAAGDTYAVIGDLGGAEPRAAVLYADEAERLCGAVTVNWPRALVQCRRLVPAGATLDEARDRLAALAPAQVGRDATLAESDQPQAETMTRAPERQ
jgi:NADPH-dependent 2,4-dienoyl-CoA reductase/sulfur reductase-like enzyme